MFDALPHAVRRLAPLAGLSVASGGDVVVTQTLGDRIRLLGDGMAPRAPSDMGRGEVTLTAWLRSPGHAPQARVLCITNRSQLSAAKGRASSSHGNTRARLPAGAQRVRASMQRSVTPINRTDNDLTHTSDGERHDHERNTY
jgi:hypothetical protein